MGEPGTGQVGAGQVCTSRFGKCQVRTGQERTSQGGQVCTGQNGQRTWDSSVALLSPTCFKFLLLIIRKSQEVSFHHVHPVKNTSPSKKIGPPRTE